MELYKSLRALNTSPPLYVMKICFVSQVETSMLDRRKYRALTLPNVMNISHQQIPVSSKYVLSLHPQIKSLCRQHMSCLYTPKQQTCTGVGGDIDPGPAQIPGADSPQRHQNQLSENLVVIKIYVVSTPSKIISLSSKYEISLF